MHSFTSNLQEKGRFGDTLIAHLSETEADVLKKAGGAGTINPFTGALEFYKGTMNNTKEGDKPSTASVFSDLVDVWESNQPEPVDVSFDNTTFAKNQALAVAKILNNTRSVFNDKEGIQQYMYFSDSGADPYSQEAWEELDNRLHEVSPQIRKLVVGGQSTGATNEDMAPRDMSIFLRAIGSDGLGSMKRGRPLVSQENLFEAYETLGITPYDYESGKRNTRGFSGDGWTEYDTVDGNPISLAQQEVTNAAANLYTNYNNQLGKSSADSDGTGGTGSMPNLGAGSFDSFSAFAEAAFAPESYNQGGFRNLAGPLGRLSREGIASWGYQQFQNMLNSPSNNPVTGKPWRNQIDDAVHFGDTLSGPQANMVGHPMGGYAKGTSDNHGYGGGYGNYGFGDGNPFGEGGD